MSINDSEFLAVNDDGSDDEPQDGRDGQPADGGSSDDPETLESSDPLRGTEAIADDAFVTDPTAVATESVAEINRAIDEELEQNGDQDSAQDDANRPEEKS